VDTAAAVARYFATTDKKASAHYCVDGGGHIVQTCLEKDVAYAAPGANSNGLHVEMAGRAAQTSEEWHDPYSRKLLVVAARLVADLCAAHRIPVRYVDAAGLVAGGSFARGVTTHHEVTKAFRKSTHTDPGPHFPIMEFVGLVLGGSPAPQPSPAPSPVVHRNTMNGVPVRSFAARIPTDANGDGGIDLCPVDKFLSNSAAAVHDKYGSTGDTDSIVVPVGAREENGVIRLTVAGGPPSTDVFSRVTIAD
jgi:hypothetical protein